MERRKPIFVKIVPEQTNVYSTSCQICNLYDAMFECNMCKKITCLKHTITTKLGGRYCHECVNNDEKFIYIQAVINADRKAVLPGKIMQKILTCISLEWTRKKKVEPIFC